MVNLSYPLARVLGYAIAACWVALSLAHVAWAADCSGINPKASKSLGDFALPTDHPCVAKMSHGFPIPDPACTPGAINPTLTLDVLRNPDFRTSCVRDKATTAHKKAETYDWYGVQHPNQN